MRILVSSVPFIFFLIFSSSITYSQTLEVAKDSIIQVEKSRFFSVGVKLGLPNLAGGSVEVILPFWDNHFAPFFDYSGFKLNSRDNETQFSYTEYGMNYFFGKKGQGFFMSVGRAQFDGKIIFKDLPFNNENGVLLASVSTPLSFDVTNIKLGIKTGGAVYFKFDIGYGFADIPSELNFTATASGISNTFSKDIPPLPGIVSGGLLIGSVGFGLSF